MNKNNSILANKIISLLKEEETHNGLKITKKIQKDSKANNDEYLKDSKNKLDKAYDGLSDESVEDKKFNYKDDEDKEYHEEMEILNGLEMIQYQNEPNEVFKKRAEEAIVGSSRMGNNPEWGNVIAKGQGGDPDFGKNLVARTKSSKKKRDDAEIPYKALGDDFEVAKGDKKNIKKLSFENVIDDYLNRETPNLDISTIFENNEPIVENNEPIVENKTDKKTMKRLKFNKIFNGVENALKMIPEGYKVDGKKFQMTDGIETVTVKWDGNLFEGAPIVVASENSVLVKENKNRILDLMGYNSKKAIGVPDKSQRLQEDAFFNLTLKKIKESVEDVKSDETNLESEPKPELNKIPNKYGLEESTGKFKAQRLDLGQYADTYVKFKNANYLKEEKLITGVEYHLTLENSSLPKEMLIKQIIETNKNKKPIGKKMKFSFYTSDGNLLTDLSKTVD